MKPARHVSIASSQDHGSLRWRQLATELDRIEFAGAGHSVGNAWAMRGQSQKRHIAHKKLLWINRLQRKTGRVGNVGNFFCGPSALRDCVGDCVGISPYI